MNQRQLTIISLHLFFHTHSHFGIDLNKKKVFFLFHSPHQSHCSSDARRDVVLLLKLVAMRLVCTKPCSMIVKEARIVFINLLYVRHA